MPDELTKMLMAQYGLSSDQAKIVVGKLDTLTESQAYDNYEDSKSKGAKVNLQAKKDIDPGHLASLIARGAANREDFRGYGPNAIAQALGRVPIKANLQYNYDRKNALDAERENKRFEGLPPNVLPGDLQPNRDYYPEAALMGAKGYAAPDDLKGIEVDYPSTDGTDLWPGGIKQAPNVDPSGLMTEPMITPAMAMKYLPLMDESRQRELATARNRQFAAEANAKYAAENGPIKSVDVGPITQGGVDLDIGPIEVKPTKPQSNLEYLKQLHEAHNERVAAHKMLKEYVMAQDAQHVNEANKGFLWSLLNPGISQR